MVNSCIIAIGGAKTLCNNKNLIRLINSCWTLCPNSRPVAGEVREVLLYVAKEVSLKINNSKNSYPSEQIESYKNSQLDIDLQMADQWQAMALMRKREAGFDSVLYDDDDWDEIGKDWAFI